jgi:phosphoenolpyruvate carboxykinase (ATP)
MIRAALSGALEQVSYQTDPIFGLETPVSVPEVPDDLLTPRASW